MSNGINYGGPAFPTKMSNDSGDKWQHEGMTLRQWYAGTHRFESEITIHQAAAVMGGEPPQWNKGDELICVRWWAEAETKLRFLYADAMIAAETV